MDNLTKENVFHGCLVIVKKECCEKYNKEWKIFQEYFNIF